MRVLVEIEFTEPEFLENQESAKLPERTVEQKGWETFVMYANPDGWCFWFIADYAVFPQPNWLENIKSNRHLRYRKRYFIIHRRKTR